MRERQVSSQLRLLADFVSALRTSGFFAISGLLSGFLLIILSHYLEVELGKNGIQSELLRQVGIAFLVAAVMVFFIEWRGEVDNANRFIDIDPPIGSSQGQEQIADALLREIRALKGQQEAVDYDRIVEEAVRKALSANRSQENLQSFSGYFSTITTLLQNKADIADQKASRLLDRGIAYTRFGIGFYVLTIAIWQFLAWSGGFKVQIIYGIASCSLLFIFIEFLSAWFLKQYRHFVDTSTFLIKLKAIFDKYMLIYMVSREYPAESLANQESSKSLLAVLSQEIEWPNSFIFDGKSPSFAKETIEALAMMAPYLKGTGNKNKESSA